jgi:hypothetical protein
MTIKELYDILTPLIESGKGNTIVKFDTEAVCFNTHMVQVDGVVFEPKEITGLDQDEFVLHWEHKEGQYRHYTYQLEKLLEEFEQNIYRPFHNIEQEYILCAAIWYKDLPLKKPEVLENRGYRPYNVDKGIVFSGWRHPNCLYQMVAIYGEPDSKVGEHIQGFLTSKNRFVDRKEGAEVAARTKQTDTLKSILFSEDLY